MRVHVCMCVCACVCACVCVCVYVYVQMGSNVMVGLISDVILSFQIFDDVGELYGHHQIALSDVAMAPVATSHGFSYTAC